MQQKNRQEQTLRFQVRKLWDNINPGGNPENKRTKQKIDGQNAHRLFARSPIMPERSVAKKWPVLWAVEAITHLGGNRVCQELGIVPVVTRDTGAVTSDDCNCCPTPAPHRR